MNQAAVRRNPAWQSKYNCDILIRSAQTESLSFLIFFFLKEFKLLEVKLLGRDPAFDLREIVLLLFFIPEMIKNTSGFENKTWRIGTLYSMQNKTMGLFHISYFRGVITSLIK